MNETSTENRLPYDFNGNGEYEGTEVGWMIFTAMALVALVGVVISISSRSR